MKYKRPRAAVKAFGSILCLVLLLVELHPAVRQVRDIPSDIYAEALNGTFPAKLPGKAFGILNESEVTVSGDLSETLSENGEKAGERYAITLFRIPIKRINVHLRENVVVIPGGISVGISMHTDGVLVVGLGSIDTEKGRVSPGAAAGIRAGDVLLTINGIYIEGADHMEQLAKKNGEIPFTVTVLREGEPILLSVTPAKDLKDGAVRIGLWVRESTAGIGTLTFVQPETKCFGALGHAVTDADTGKQLRIKKGELIKASVVGVSPGQQGAPGELRGTFSTFSERLGKIEANTPSGIFGTMHCMFENPLYPGGLPVGYADTVKEGPATLLSGVDGDGVKAYSCEILRLSEQESSGTKGIVLRVTDEQLLQKTGGIVQGMSGSPIIQDGKLVGAVTHVLVNDPTRGYGIFIENMLDAAG